MSMKSAETPRKIYSRNGIIHVLTEGKTFGPSKGETRLDLDTEVIVTKAPSDGGRARVEVSQPRRGKSTLKEVWRAVTVPTNPRS